jgi:hypothetical protein
MKLNKINLIKIGVSGSGEKIMEIEGMAKTTNNISPTHFVNHSRNYFSL